MKKQVDREVWRDALAATSLGWDLALPIFGGVIIGYLLDRKLSTGHGFTLGLLALGTVAGFYNVFRFIRRLEKRDQLAAMQTRRDETTR